MKTITEYFSAQERHDLKDPVRLGMTSRSRQVQRLSRVVCSILFVLVPCALRANTFYVATTGNDRNPGTQSAPFRHVSKGASVTLAGDTVVVEDGTYDNEGKVAPNYVIDLWNSGTPTQPITIKAEHRGAAILDGGLTSSNSCNGAYAYFNLHSTSYIVIQGFQIQHTCDEAIHNNDAAHHITIQQNEIHHIANIPAKDSYGRDGIYCNQATHDLIFDSNVWHDIGRSNSGYTTSLDHAIYSHGSNITITNNVFYNQVDGWDIQLANGTNNVLIANNTFASHNPGQYGQIMVWDSNSNLTIRNNIFYNPPAYAVTTYTASVNSCSIDTNLISGTAGVYNGGGCSTSGNKMNLDPVFVNAQAQNFQLQPSSPAIDAGATISTVVTDNSGTYRPQGSAYDIGAFEYASGNTTSTPTPASAPTPTPTPTLTLTTGLAANWSLNEGKGTTVADSSGNQNTGTFVGTPQWVTGTYGTALSFNGNNSYIDVKESASLEQSKELTVSFWILASPVSGDPRIVAKSYSWDIELNGGSHHPQFSAAGKYAMLQYSLPVGTWQHVAFTFSSGVVKGYVNGASLPFAQNTFAGGEILPAMSYGLLIGTDAGKQYFANGFLRDVRLYDRVLTDSEVKALYSETAK